MLGKVSLNCYIYGSFFPTNNIVPCLNSCLENIKIIYMSAQFPLLPHQSWWKERYAYCKMSVYFLNNVNLFLWSLVNSFNLYCLMGNGSWCWCQFLFCVKLDCSVATSTPSIFWLSFHLNICDKWVLTVNFSSSNVVLFYPMNVATNHTPQSYIPQGYSTLTLLW